MYPSVTSFLMYSKLLFVPALVGTLLLLLSSCSRSVVPTEVKALTADHRTLAVVPPDVFIAEDQDFGPSSDFSRLEALNFQQRMYTWWLRGKSQNHIFVTIQKVQETNDRLHQAGYFDGRRLSRPELCALLGVDAVLLPTYELKETTWLAAMRQGRTGASGVRLELYDQQTQRVIWGYRHRLSWDTRRVPSRAVDELMLSAGRRNPYYYSRTSFFTKNNG
jgi:hypothetical protein